jgi:hypothetical protein
MSKLLDYLNTLDKDAAAREAHAKDPKAAMKEFGLTEEEQAALISGDRAKIADLSGIDLADLASPQVTHTTPDDGVSFDV